MVYVRSTEWDALPGECGYPLIGNTVQLMQNPPLFAKRRYERYGEASKASIMGNPAVFLLGPKANEVVMRDRSKRFSSTLAYKPFIGSLFPGTLGIKDFEEHAKDRRILHSAFTKSALTSYSHPIHDITKRDLQNWQAESEVSFFYKSKNLFLEQAVKLFLDSDVNHDAKVLGNHFLNLMSASTAVLRLPIPFTRYWRGLKGKDFLWEHLERSLPEKKTKLTEDLFSQVCHAQSEEGEKLSDHQIVGHMLGLLSAGHETTTSAATSIAYSISKWPEFQERMREEMFALKEEPDFETSKSLEYSGWVFNEAMRLSGPSHSIPRHALESFQFNDLTIPKDCTIYLSPSFTHRMEEYWTNPNAFDPERFSPQREEHKQEKFLYMPFGGGAHICIGMIFAELQIKIFFWHLLRRFRLELSDASDAFDLKYTPLPIPKNGLKLRLRKLS